MKVVIMNPCVSLPLDDEKKSKLLHFAENYALLHGLCMKSTSDTFGQIGILPFTLLPSPFPRSQFELVQSLQTDINLLVHKVAHDHEFLNSCLESIIKVDDFIERLFRIYRDVRQSEKSQKYSLGIFRTDYLLDQMEDGSIGIKQVETNTIASGLSVMSPKISWLHSQILKFLPEKDPNGRMILEMNPDVKVAKGLVDALKAYNKPGYSSNNIMFLIIADNNVNILDQRGLEYHIITENVDVVWCTYKEVYEKAKLNETSNALIFDGKEIGVVYLRTGYHSGLFDCENDWTAARMIEMSMAIKCPSVQYHLAGCKKIQQVLSEPGVLEKFLDDPLKIEKLRTTFASLYSLDMNEFGDSAVAKALNEPAEFVMKPQREGGGNNLYDEDLYKELDAIKNSSKRAAYILMDRISPPTDYNYIVSRSRIEFTNIVNELGIYGVILGSDDDIRVNEEVGYLLRSKPASVNEGGIMCGCAYINTPLLYDC